MIKFIDEKEIIDPKEVVKRHAEVVKNAGITAAVTTFSNHLFDIFVGKFGAEKIISVTGGMDNDLYTITVDGKKVLLYKSPVGAPAAVMAAEEVLGCGIKSIVAFGICGSLVNMPPRTFLVPTRAFRDEGTSCHYLPSEDWIELRGSQKVLDKIREEALPAISGGAWTTDAMYRETRSRMSEMTSAGCIAVDMECSALQALCDYRGADFYTFFISADSLSGEKWQPNYILDITAETADEAGVTVAAKLAASL